MFAGSMSPHPRDELPNGLTHTHRRVAISILSTAFSFLVNAGHLTLIQWPLVCARRRQWAVCQRQTKLQLYNALVMKTQYAGIHSSRQFWSTALSVRRYLNLIAAIRSRAALAHRRPFRNTRIDHDIIWGHCLQFIFNVLSILHRSVTGYNTKCRLRCGNTKD